MFTDQVSKLYETGMNGKYFGRQNLGKQEQWVKSNEWKVNRVYHLGFFGTEKTLYLLVSSHHVQWGRYKSPIGNEDAIPK